MKGWGKSLGLCAVPTMQCNAKHMTKVSLGLPVRLGTKESGQAQ